MSFQNQQEVMAHFVKSCRNKYEKGELGAQGILNGDLDVNSGNTCLYKYPCDIKDKDYRCAIGAGFDEEDIKLINEMDGMGSIISSFYSDLFDEGCKYEISKDNAQDFSDLYHLQSKHDDWSKAEYRLKDSDSDIYKQQRELCKTEFLKELERLEAKYYND